MSRLASKASLKGNQSGEQLAKAHMVLIILIHHQGCMNESTLTCFLALVVRRKAAAKARQRRGGPSEADGVDNV